MKKLILAVAMAIVAVLNVQSATHAKVQLWEGGPYWATTNIGADNPWDYGLYFWWGDTTGYRPSGTTFSFNFSDGNSAIYTYGRSVPELQSAGWVTSDGVLMPTHDAAHVKWGGAWRMPTYQEVYDLYNKCDWFFSKMNDVYGYVVRGRGAYATSSIFLPCARCARGTSDYVTGGFYSYYWSSKAHTGPSSYHTSWGLYFSNGSRSVDYYNNLRYYGFPIRPVQGSNEGGNCVIHFNANGGTGNMDEQTFEALQA